MPHESDAWWMVLSMGAVMLVQVGALILGILLMVGSVVRRCRMPDRPAEPPEEAGVRPAGLAPEARGPSSRHCIHGVALWHQCPACADRAAGYQSVACRQKPGQDNHQQESGQ